MSSSKFRILDAAERIVLRDGAAHLTLDAVAAETPLSKGGLLYHFASKDDLVRAMIARLLDEFEAEIARRLEADPNPVGRQTRALLDALVTREPGASSHLDCVCASLLAAVANNPSLLAPVQDRFLAMQQRILEDGLDPVAANVVALAADGLWFHGLMHFPPLDPELRDRVVAHLRTLTEVL